jgi:hypothetical protein
MRTIILEVLTDGEKTKYSVQKTHAFIEYHFTDETKSQQNTNMNYDMKQPGGLTDVQFMKTKTICTVVIGLVHLGMCFIKFRHKNKF